MQRKCAASLQKMQRIIYRVTKNTMKNRFGSTENAPNLFYTLLKYPQSFKFSSSICTNQAPAFQQTCLYLRRNSARVSMLSVTGRLSVLRISLGITTLPRSSILLTIPVAFISKISLAVYSLAKLLQNYCLTRRKRYSQKMAFE